MKIRIKTEVEAPLNIVWNNFTEELFTSLNPPFPPVKLIRFDGSNTNDVVELELNFILFKQKWISLITAQTTTESYIEFIDEGTTLPFFLSKWKHQHRMEKTEKGTCIIDNIEYKAPFLLSFLLYPTLLLQFMYRKPIYKKFFKSKATV